MPLVMAAIVSGVIIDAFGSSRDKACSLLVASSFAIALHLACSWCKSRCFPLLVAAPYLNARCFALSSSVIGFFLLQRSEVYEDQHKQCFICGLESSAFSQTGGFERHWKDDHFVCSALLSVGRIQTCYLNI